MIPFTFFLTDGSIVQIDAVHKNDAMRELCHMRCRSWIEMHREIEDCLAPESLAAHTLAGRGRT